MRYDGESKSTSENGAARMNERFISAPGDGVPAQSGARSSSKATATDGELARRVANGDEGAFRELVEKHQRTILNVANRYLGNYDAADDIAQEVFLKLWTKAGTFKGNSKFSTWLYRVAVNECLQYRRRRKQVVVSLDSLDADQPPESLQVAADHERTARIERVKKAIAALPDRQRIALVLAHYEGRSYQEIGEIMNVSVASVESLILRAKENLKSKLT
jgi:RNA polymerase sigma-70 factor, ECF subfamily